MSGIEHSDFIASFPITIASACHYIPSSPSFDRDNVHECDPAELGSEILSIWNTRVNAVRALYEHLRTVVLIKSDDLLEVTVFEVDTILYNSEAYIWSWNRNQNLVAHEKDSGIHRFTWQPHGAQFTITEEVPTKKICIRLKQPPGLDRDKVLSTVDFDPSWVQIIRES